MKRLKFLPTVLLSAGLVAVSCTNLDEDLKDKFTQANFPKTNAELDALLVAPYTKLYNNYGHNGYFTLQEVTTDEAMIPQRGGDWFDGGQPQGLHSHFQTQAQAKPEGFDAFNNVWGNAFEAISACNRLMDTPGIKENGDKVAELTVLRAWFYYYLLDFFGNVPKSTKLGTSDGQQTPSAMYAFIESDILANVDKLPKTPNYGRLTYWAGKAILAKLYLNAKTYTGTAQYGKALTVLTEIANSGKFSLEANYFDTFSATNNGSVEHIWAVPFDRGYVKGFNLAQMTLHYGSQATYKLQQQPWNGYCTLEEFYNSYSPADKRIKSFIVGQQFASDGVTKIIDESAENNDPDGKPVNFTPKVNEFLPNALRQSGARLGKFQFAIGSLPDLDNDFPVFRLGGVLLDMAECSFRLAGNWTDATGLGYLNQVRVRTGLAPYNNSGVVASGGLDENEFLAERGRELFSEAWRRNDLVRFGQYGRLWFGKKNIDPDNHLNLFPIPLPQITANAALKQNPGY